jgi:hypothetical protein
MPQPIMQHLRRRRRLHRLHRQRYHLQYLRLLCLQHLQPIGLLLHWRGHSLDQTIKVRKRRRRMQQTLWRRSRQNWQPRPADKAFLVQAPVPCKEDLRNRRLLLLVVRLQYPARLSTKWNRRSHRLSLLAAQIIRRLFSRICKLLYQQVITLSNTVLRLHC